MDALERKGFVKRWHDVSLTQAKELKRAYEKNFLDVKMRRIAPQLYDVYTKSK